MGIDTLMNPAPDRILDAPLLAGVELGGTKIICTLGTGPDAILDSRRIATGEAEATLAAIEAVLDGWVQSYPAIAALGLASFGPIELDPAAPDYGSITRTTKPGWSGTDVANRIRRRYDLPLAFDTDVNGAALAEGRWGAARGLRSWVYITIGTGVGAGIIIDNRAVRGLGHSEAGHMVVRRSRHDSFAGICPYHGDCVEGLVSGPAIAAHTGLKGEHIPDDHPVWESVSTTIAEMLHNLAMSTAPERIILGGGVIERRPSLFPAIRRALVDSLASYAHTPAIADNVDRFIVPPALGAMAGPLGALALALDAAPERPVALREALAGAGGMAVASGA
jgi:fructokinase